MEEITPPFGFPIPEIEKVKGKEDEEAQKHICFGQSRLEEILITGEEDSS